MGTKFAFHGFIGGGLMRADLMRTGLMSGGVVCSGAICLLMTAGVARAQLAGTYSGTQANGATISLTVTQKNAKFELSGLGVGIMTTCPDGEAINEDTGIGFEPVPIPKPKFTFELLANPELYVKVVMLFDDAKQSVSGMITSYVPALKTFTKHPRQSETCISAEKFTADLGGAVQTAGRKPKMVIY